MSFKFVSSTGDDECYDDASEAVDHLSTFGDVLLDSGEQRGGPHTVAWYEYGHTKPCRVLQGQPDNVLEKIQDLEDDYVPYEWLMAAPGRRYQEVYSDGSWAEVQS